ncbi:histidine phosphatase family protein [Paenibacillus sp. N1-5-1-14]|nr:histidine phosphatase family protein [Paenibacillus radicibacter]
MKAAAGTNEITLFDDLREREIGQFEGMSFKDAKLKVYTDTNHSFPEGESSASAQLRVVRVIERILNEHEGKRIVIGTHGDIMTLIINYYDKQYDYEFWQSTSMPDIYSLEFIDMKLEDIRRLWQR